MTTSGNRQQKKKLEKEKEWSKRVQVVWKHFQEEVKDYVFVPLSKGDGSRYAVDVMKLCKSIFLPNEVSYFGKTEDMLFALGNFHNEHMGVTLEENGRELPFKIGNYMEAFKLKDVRLSLLSKKLTTSSDESDDGLPPMIMRFGDASNGINTTLHCEHNYGNLKFHLTASHQKLLD